MLGTWNAQEGWRAEQLVLEGGEDQGDSRPGGQRQVEALVDVVVQQVRQHRPLATAGRGLIRLSKAACVHPLACARGDSIRDAWGHGISCMHGRVGEDWLDVELLR